MTRHNMNEHNACWLQVFTQKASTVLNTDKPSSFLADPNNQGLKIRSQNLHCPQLEDFFAQVPCREEGLQPGVVAFSAALSACQQVLCFRV